MGDISAHVTDSAARVSGINDAIHTMAASSEQIAASVGTVGDQVDFVYQDMQNIVEIAADNTISLQEINDVSAKLHDTAQASFDGIGKKVGQMSQSLQEEKRKAEAVLRIKEPVGDDTRNIRPDEPAGAECVHRGGESRRGGKGICGSSGRNR